MKILFIAPQFYPKNTGYANAFTRFVRLLNKMGEKIDVLTFQNLNEHEEIDKKNLRIYRIKYKKIIKGINYLIKQTKLIKKILQLDKKNNYDIIFYETLSYSLALFLLSMTKKSKKMLIRIHGCISTEGIVFGKQIYTKIFFILLKKTLKNLNFISATTPYYINFSKKEFLGNNPLICGKKIFTTIPNFSHSDIIKPKDMLPEINQILDQKTTFLTLGGMETEGKFIQKGIIDIICAIFFLKNKNYFKKLRLIIIGRGKYKNLLVRVVERLNLSQNIIFIEQLPNTQIQYLQSRVGAVIMASRFEGLSMFALEALSNGSPLIVSEVGGLIDIVEDGKNGFLFKPQNISQLSKKIDYFIKNTDIKIFRENSKNLYKQKFSPEKIYENFSNIAKIIIASHN